MWISLNHLSSCQTKAFSVKQALQFLKTSEAFYQSSFKIVKLSFTENLFSFSKLQKLFLKVDLSEQIWNFRKIEEIFQKSKKFYKIYVILKKIPHFVLMPSFDSKTITLDCVKNHKQSLWLLEHARC